METHRHAHTIDTAENGAALAARLARAEAACAARGVRLTDMRRDVLRLILQAGEPVGAYALLDGLRALTGGGKPPTVYRALDFLLAQGLIHRVEKLNAFVGCHDEAAHHHAAQFLICKDCGQATEIENTAVADAITQAAQAAGFYPTRATVEVEGTCAGCITNKLGGTEPVPAKPPAS
jgi:Fur family zinc uptake transcriptional regulator